MKSALALALVVLTSMPVIAQGHDISLRDALHDAAHREAMHLAKTMGTAPQPPSALVRERGWVGRHPVLTGALVGFGAGFTIGAVTCRYPTVEGSSCADYTFPGNARLLGGLTIGGLGAGIGAGVGAVIHATR